MPDPHQTPRKITLEDLLRLKRHERPGPEYWARFDRELNEKVWRTLVQPVPRANWLAALWDTRLRWLAVGGASLVAIFLSWSGRVDIPVAATPATRPSPVAANEVAPLSLLPASEPVRVAEVFPAPERNPEVTPLDTPAQFAVSTLDTTVNRAGHNKVPATVAFAVERTNGVHYASDALSTTASATHWRESAY